MLFAASGLRGSTVQATDDRVGTAKDFLFDDQAWQIRWMVVDTGSWLPGRKVLIHASAIQPLHLAGPEGSAPPMMHSLPLETLSVRLARQQIEDGPELAEEEPVSAEIELQLYRAFGWNPAWGTTFMPAGAIADRPREPDEPHLHGIRELDGSRLHATDGEIGHVADIFVDDGAWDIRYLKVATRSWWPGQSVLLAPFAVRHIDWHDRRLELDVSREQVRTSPPWDPMAMIDRMTEQQLHAHYGWPGYGW